MITEAEIECRLDDSYKEGVEKGIEQGIEQGALNAKREMAKSLKEQGFQIGAIEKASGLSEEEIKSL
jgi:predicted transposase/invertase (TIGR01784 family)